MRGDFRVAICDLDGVRSAATGALGVSAGAVPADDLHAWMLGQSARRWSRITAGQHVNDAVGLAIRQHGAIPMTPGREVVDAENPRSWPVRVRQCLDQSDQRHPSARNSGGGCQTRSSTPDQRQSDPLTQHAKTQRAAPVPECQAPDLLDERATRACHGEAHEPANPQCQAHRQPCQRHIGRMPQLDAPWTRDERTPQPGHDAEMEVPRTAIHTSEPLRRTDSTTDLASSPNNTAVHDSTASSMSHTVATPRLARDKRSRNARSTKRLQRAHRYDDPLRPLPESVTDPTSDRRKHAPADLGFRGLDPDGNSDDPVIVTGCAAPSAIRSDRTFRMPARQLS
ncbi:hypothetical protein ABH920_001934 [Catenulispora sp. EB89]